ncbi:MAG TPA: Ig-like domain-containing protein [Ramlibacter sp.]|nr:Ig-like domain-containing protein [Ramlibacter sp.]
MTQFLRMAGGLVLAALMTACGGGGGSPGTTTAGGTTVDGSPTLKVTDFALFTDKTTLNNSGTDKAQLTVVTVDANRNAVTGAKVSVASDQNSVFAPDTSDSVTDKTGTFSGSVSTGADKTDRDITLAVTVNGITKQTAVKVAGSKLTLQAVPSTPSPGQTVTLTASLVDSAGIPIPNVSVKLGGTLAALVSQTITTGLTGSASKSFIAPAASGAYTITASGSGVNAADYQIQVFTSAIPVAVIPPDAKPSLAASPNVLAVNAPGSTSNKSTLRFLFLDKANNPIKNVRVRFVDITTGLPAIGASISSGTTTLYTDASGTVSADYISGQNSSPTNGVNVNACYSASDFGTNVDSATGCPTGATPVTALLTVAGQALAVSIGDDNVLQKGAGTYIKRFAVTVADAAGRAVAGAPVDISVDLTHYSKGVFLDPFFNNAGVSLAASDRLGLTVVPPNVPAQAYPSSPAADPSGANSPRYSVNPGTKGQRIWCANEDLNRNGNVDPGENLDGSLDANLQPTLEPRKSDLIVSYDVPTVTTTNAGGILVIKVEYSQRFATWLAYKVRVTANVAGSQGMAERLFVTDAVDTDFPNGSFRQPPYGINACQNVN